MDDLQKMAEIRAKFADLERISATKQRIKDEIHAFTPGLRNVALQSLDDIPHHFGAYITHTNFKLIVSITIEETYPFKPPKITFRKQIPATATTSTSTNTMTPEDVSRMIGSVNKTLSHIWRPWHTLMSALYQVDEWIEKWKASKGAAKTDEKEFKDDVKSPLRELGPSTPHGDKYSKFNSDSTIDSALAGTPLLQSKNNKQQEMVSEYYTANDISKTTNAYDARMISHMLHLPNISSSCFITNEADKANVQAFMSVLDRIASPISKKAFENTIGTYSKFEGTLSHFYKFPRVGSDGFCNYCTKSNVTVEEMYKNVSSIGSIHFVNSSDKDSFKRVADHVREIKQEKLQIFQNMNENNTSNNKHNVGNISDGPNNISVDTQEAASVSGYDAELLFLVLILDDEKEYEQYTSILKCHDGDENGLLNKYEINKDCLNYEKLFFKYGNVEIDENEQLFDASMALLKHENNKIENASWGEIGKAILEVNWFRDIAFNRFCQQRDEKNEENVNFNNSQSENENVMNKLKSHCVML